MIESFNQSFTHPWKSQPLLLHCCLKYLARGPALLEGVSICSSTAGLKLHISEAALWPATPTSSCTDVCTNVMLPAVEHPPHSMQALTPTRLLAVDWHWASIKPLLLLAPVWLCGMCMVPCVHHLFCLFLSQPAVLPGIQQVTSSMAKRTPAPEAELSCRLLPCVA